MTINIPENQVQNPSVDTNVSQQTHDANVSQKKVENNPKQDGNLQNQNGQQQQPNTTEAEADPNWKAFREARKKDRAEREAAERRAAEKDAEVAALKAAMEAAFSRGNSPQQAMSQQTGYQEEETEDQRIERKVEQKLAAKEAQYRKEAEEREIREYPARLQQTHPDFTQTISQENLDYLDYHYPEVSRPLQRLKDGYDKWSDIYLAIKKFVPNHSNAKKEAAKADSNFNKPKSISSTGLTQAQAVPGSHILTEERKAANWARMQASMKGVG
jgi:uncharacterized membrane protein YqiK